MIDRETIIERSVDAYLRQQLYVVRNYPADRVTILDAYPTNQRMSEPLDRNYVAIGWSADDGGRQAELGSPLRRRVFTFDFYVFGISRIWAKNLASVVRASLEADGVIDLINPVDQSNLGHVDVISVAGQQAVTPNPRPWQENAWIVRLRVEDIYSSSGGG